MTGSVGNRCTRAPAVPGKWQVHNDVLVTEEDFLPFSRPSMACSIVIQMILVGSVAGGKGE